MTLMGSYQQPQLPRVEQEGRLLVTDDKDRGRLTIETSSHEEVLVGIEEEGDGSSSLTTFTLSEEQALRLAEDLTHLVESKRKVKAQLDEYALGWAHNAAAIKGIKGKR